MAFSEGHALVIGVRSHKFSKENDVPITYQDAEAVYNILIDEKKCGYPRKQVKFLHDGAATAQGIKDELKKLAKAKPTDTVFIFFAGHGAFGTDNNYTLATHDVKFVATGDNDLRIEAGTGLSQTELVESFKKIEAHRVMLIFNTCHSGSLHPKSLAPKPKALAGQSLPSITASALLGTGEGRIVITACKPNQLSNYYHDEQLTFFSQALTDGLNGKAVPSKGYISAFNLYAYVYEKVTDIARQAHVEQDPMITVLQGVGPFSVALAPKTPAALNPALPKGLPATDSVRYVTKQQSLDWLNKIEQNTLVMEDYVEGDKVEGDKVLGDKIDRQINTDGGAFVTGPVKITNGNFIGRDQINNSSPSADSVDATSLRQRLLNVLLSGTFSLDDLKDISELMGIDWDRLKGSEMPAKANALIEQCEAAGKLDQLKKLISRLRPGLGK